MHGHFTSPSCVRLNRHYQSHRAGESYTTMVGKINIRDLTHEITYPTHRESESYAILWPRIDCEIDGSTVYPAFSVFDPDSVAPTENYSRIRHYRDGYVFFALRLVYDGSPRQYGLDSDVCAQLGGYVLPRDYVAPAVVIDRFQLWDIISGWTDDLTLIPDVIEATPSGDFVPSYTSTGLDNMITNPETPYPAGGGRTTYSRVASAMVCEAMLLHREPFAKSIKMSNPSADTKRLFDAMYLGKPYVNNAGEIGYFRDWVSPEFPFGNESAPTQSFGLHEDAGFTSATTQIRQQSNQEYHGHLWCRSVGTGSYPWFDRPWQTSAVIGLNRTETTGIDVLSVPGYASIFSRAGVLNDGYPGFITFVYQPYQQGQIPTHWMECTHNEHINMVRHVEPVVLAMHYESDQLIYKYIGG